MSSVAERRSTHPAPVSRMPVGWRIFGGIRSALLSIAAVIGAVCIVAFVAALAFGVRPVAVISGSMEPGIPVGSMAFIREVPAGEMHVGEVVTVERPRDLGLVTHRLVSTTEREPGVYEYVLRGDANDSDDPQPYVVETVGRYLGHAILLGYLTIVLQSANGLLVAGGIALFLIAIFVLDPARIFAARRGAAAD